MLLLKPIDNFLNNITMYRLVWYGLMVLAVISIAFGFLNLLPYSGFQFLITLGIVLVTCFVTNKVFANLYKAPANVESYWITAFILFFILAPVTNITDVYITIAAGIIAIASKFLIAIEKKHIFNPAAISIFLLGLFGFGNGIWWVGSEILLPFVAIIGLLVVRKIRRFHLLFPFLGAAIITICLFNIRNQVSIQDSFVQAFTSWPLVFFGTIMLTEPLTTPPRKKLYMMYGTIVGILFGSQFHIGPLFSSPEFALVAGNVFSYIVSPKQKLILILKNKKQLAPHIWDFSFVSTKSLNFRPGQYLEWTLPHKKSDSRGNRRFFTIASSPTQDALHLGVRFSDPGSSFKKALLELESGKTIVGSQLTGDFTMPEDQNIPLVFIAGGIGITPFVSMVQYLLGKNEKRSITLFYANSLPEDLVYKEKFDEAARRIGFKPVYVITKKENAPKDWSGKTGYVTEDMIKAEVSDYKKCEYYLSGPQAMVTSYKEMLGRLGIPRKMIKTDYFPGF